MNSDRRHKKVINIADKYKNSEIDPKASIGKNVKIGPYSIIGPQVIIGDNTEIGSHVTITGNTTIGENNKIYHGASLGQSLKDSKTSLFIGDNNIIREFVSIYRGSIKGNGETKIGNNNMIMAYCHLSANCQLASEIIISNAASLGEEVMVEDHAVIAGMSNIKEHVRIGRIAMIGAHSNVLKDVSPYIIVDGHPAQVSGINIIGLRRSEIKPQIRKEIKRAYKILYRSDLTIKAAIQEMDSKLNAGDEIEHFLRFLRNVERGICR